MSEKICKYCDEPIGDLKWIFLYFSEDKRYLPVHLYHIQARKEQHGN